MELDSLPERVRPYLGSALGSRIARDGKVRGTQTGEISLSRADDRLMRAWTVRFSIVLGMAPPLPRMRFTGSRPEGSPCSKRSGSHPRGLTSHRGWRDGTCTDARRNLPIRAAAHGTIGFADEHQRDGESDAPARLTKEPRRDKALAGKELPLPDQSSDAARARGHTRSDDRFRSSSVARVTIALATGRNSEARTVLAADEQTPSSRRSCVWSPRQSCAEASSEGKSDRSESPA
jgi:hypothetical protein